MTPQRPTEDCDRRQNEDRRESCSRVVTLEARFADFIERYERDLDDRMEWRKKVDYALEAINETIRDLKLPYRVGLWITVLAAGAMMVEAVKIFFNWISSHVR